MSLFSLLKEFFSPSKKYVDKTLYRVRVNKSETYNFWSEGYLYILASTSNRAKMKADRFRFRGICYRYKNISICGRKSQKNIKVLTHKRELITLDKLVERYREPNVSNFWAGIIAYSPDKECINRRFAFEIIPSMNGYHVLYE